MQNNNLSQKYKVEIKPSKTNRIIQLTSSKHLFKFLLLKLVQSTILNLFHKNQNVWQADIRMLNIFLIVIIIHHDNYKINSGQNKEISCSTWFVQKKIQARIK